MDYAVLIGRLPFVIRTGNLTYRSCSTREPTAIYMLLWIMRNMQRVWLIEEICTGAPYAAFLCSVDGTWIIVSLSTLLYKWCNVYESLLFSIAVSISIYSFNRAQIVISNFYYSSLRENFWHYYHATWAIRSLILLLGKWKSFIS